MCVCVCECVCVCVCVSVCVCVCVCVRVRVCTSSSIKIVHAPNRPVPKTVYSKYLKYLNSFTLPFAEPLSKGGNCHFFFNSHHTVSIELVSTALVNASFTRVRRPEFPRKEVTTTRKKTKTRLWFHDTSFRSTGENLRLEPKTNPFCGREGVPRLEFVNAAEDRNFVFSCRTSIVRQKRGLVSRLEFVNAAVHSAAVEEFFVSSS